MIDKALAVDDRPSVIDFRVDPTEMCFPMIPAGASNDDIIVGPVPSADGPATAPREDGALVTGGLAGEEAVGA